jgi:hypothetical protein
MLSEHARPDAAVVNNGGVFLINYVCNVIDGREAFAGHGTREMPIWGKHLSFRAAPARRLSPRCGRVRAQPHSRRHRLPVSAAGEVAVVDRPRGAAAAAGSSAQAAGGDGDRGQAGSIRLGS